MIGQEYNFKSAKHRMHSRLVFLNVVNNRKHSIV